MHLIPFRRREKSPRPSLLTLPPELRLKIYNCLFEDSYTRYWREKVIRNRKLVKVAFCRGPEEHALLLTCQQIYNEASPLLVSAAYFLLDQTKVSTALICIEYIYHHAHLSPWLTRLMQGTKRLVVSKPGGAIFWNARPIFKSLETIDMFGFYPTLQRWIKRDRTISMGWGMWYWKLFWYHSNMHLTKNPRVNFGRTARWLHANLDKPSQQIKLYLHAWELDDEPGAERSGEAYYVTIDLDTKEIITRERIQFRPKLDRCGTILENSIKHYHDFLKITAERRKEWLKEERKGWPEVIPVTAIATETDKR